MAMHMISEASLTQEVGRLLEVLYRKRFGALEKLSLLRLLNKNPYLYRALGISDSSEFIMQLMIAFVSSSDETIFGNDFFEPLAIFAARQGDQHGDADWKVTVGAGAGQDIAIETANSYLAISVKSGKNIFNSQSVKGQSTEFTALTSRLRKLNKELRAIIGYGYGRKRQIKASNVEKIAGQAFWQLLTGDENFYLRLSSAMADFSGEHGTVYKAAFEQKHQQCLREFMIKYVDEQGMILWEKIVAFNSAVVKPAAPKRIKKSRL
jgi:Type II restriction endonuclease EcoO109I